MIEFNPQYKIGEKIYHKTIGSEQGLIIDINLKVSTREISYLIATGWAQECWALERELSKDKIIV